MNDKEFTEFFGVAPGKPKTPEQLLKDINAFIEDNSDLIDKAKKENK